MKAFRRTRSGLENQHLFYDVDIVVYVEGGKQSFNKDEVYAGKFNNETEDIIFWGKIFENFTNVNKIKFKSVGSKTTIKDIALDIINGHVKSVYVAMDNEFDEILDQRIKHPNVFYTHGYSWENDVWNHMLIEGIVEELTAIKINNDDIEINFNNFLKKIKIAVYADAYLFKKHDSFFPRKSGYMFCVDCNPSDLPYIKNLDIDKKLVNKGLKKSTLYNFGRKKSIETAKFCYGHLLADYCCQLVIHYLKKRHSLSNISKEIIYRMGLNKHFQKHFSAKSGTVYDYYQQQFKMSNLNRVL